MTTARTRFEWNGDELLAEIEDAARAAVNATVDAARDDAKMSHPWRSRSGRLEANIETEHAEPGDPNPAGRVGYTRRRGFYGLFHEEGTVHEHAFPTIRPAVDRQFPGFVERIRRRLK